MDFSKKVSIFKNAEYTHQFQRDGYIILPFLNQAQITELSLLYKKLYPNGVKGFFSTTFANNPAHRKEVNYSIRDICLNRINELFENYKIYFSSFIVKAAEPNSELIMHQDMTLVNEDIYTGMNIWCPLIDLDNKNGAIEILPKSHRIYKTYRGSSLPDIYDGLQEEVKKYMHPLYLKAGEAVIFDQSIIHYSPPNLSTEERPVINTFIAHRESTIQICYRDKENNPDKVEIFQQEDNFLEEYENFGSNIFAKPSIGKSLGFIDYDCPYLTKKKLDTLYGKKSVFQKWFPFLKSIHNF